MIRVLITRPTGAAQAPADDLRAAGHDVLVCPLVSFAKTQIQTPSLAATQGFIVTDADGARALADAVGVRTFPVFCDSAGTAAELAGLGFHDARSADGDTTALARLIERSLSPKLGGLIYACSTSAPINLSAMLGNMGFAVRMAALYEVQRAERLPDVLTTALKDQTLDAAVFFTADEARAFAQLVVRAQLEQRVSNIIAVVAAPVVAAPLSVLKFAKVVTASRSDASSVCRMVTDALLPQLETMPIPAPEPPPEAIPEPVVEPVAVVQAQPETVEVKTEIVAESIAAPEQEPEPEPPAPLSTEAPPTPEPVRPSWRERWSTWFAKPATPSNETAREEKAETPIVVVETQPQEPELIPEPVAVIEIPDVVPPPPNVIPEPQQPVAPSAPEPTRPQWSERPRQRFAEPDATPAETAAETLAPMITTPPEPVPESVVVADIADAAPPPPDIIPEPQLPEEVSASGPARPSWSNRLRARFTKPAAPAKEVVTEIVEPVVVSPAAPEMAAPEVTSIGPSVARALLERTSAWVRQRAEARKAEGESAPRAPEPAPEPEPATEPVVIVAMPVAPVASVQPTTPLEPLPPIEAAETAPSEPKPVSDESFAAAREGWLDWAKNYLATKTVTPNSSPIKTETVDVVAHSDPLEQPRPPTPEPEVVVAALPPEETSPAETIEPVKAREQDTTTLSELRPAASRPPAKRGWMSRMWTPRAPTNDTPDDTTAPAAPVPTSASEQIESAPVSDPPLTEKTPPIESPLATMSAAADVPPPVPDPPPEPPAAFEPLIVVPPPVKTPETPPKTIAVEMSEPEIPSNSDQDAPRAQRAGGRAARLFAEDAADARALNQRFKVAGSDAAEDETEPSSTPTAPMPGPPRRGLPGVVYVMLLLIVAGGAAYVYVPDLMKSAPAPATPVAKAPQTTPPPSIEPAPGAPVAPVAKPEPTVAAPPPDADTLATRIAALEQRTATTPAEITALEQRLIALEVAVKAGSPAELSDSVTNQARQLTTVTARVATLEAAIGNVAKLEDMAARLNALEGKSAAAASVLALSERVSSLEKRDAVAATALVVAGAQLRDVVRAGRPYGVELETVKQLAQRAGVAFNADALSGSARTGLPTREQLLSTFMPMAAAATRAGLLPGDTADWFQRVSDRALSIISIRPFGNPEGTTPGAVLARAEQALRANNVVQAVSELDALTGPAAEAAAPWVATARTFVAADQGLDELATRSVGAMGATTATAPAQ
jgi:uroporphyrinogen-III synthase